MAKWLIYGANGYSGRLITEHALSQGLQPVLAGRSSSVIELAEMNQLEHRIFTLENSAVIQKNLADIDVLLHCAGPFSSTAEVMMKACINSHTHYTDITGEIDVFEMGWQFNADAVSAGVVICPGVGFDVIPTDCVAALLSEKITDATHLKLGFDSRSGFSPGTAKTSVEGMAKGGAVREDGVIKQVPLAYKTDTIDFGDGEKLAMTIPWGDVSTAYRTTGINNIEVYIPASPKLVGRVKKMNWIKPLLKLGFVQSLLKKKITSSVKGPDAEQRAQSATYVWGEVHNQQGKKAHMRVKVANGYDVTAQGSVAVVRVLLDKSETKQEVAGYKTPSQLCGARLIDSLDGTEYLT